MPIVYIPTPMRKLSANQSKIPVESGSFVSIISGLDIKYPGIKRQIYDDQGAIKKYVGVFVNGSDIRSMDGDATMVKDQDEIHIVPAIAGG